MLTLKVPYNRHCRNAVERCHSFLWQWIRRHYLIPMMSLNWESRRKLTANFSISWLTGHQVVTITRFNTWIIAAASLTSVYVGNTGSLTSPAVHGNCSAITNLSSEWDYYHRDYGHKFWVAPVIHSHCLSVNDYCQKNRDGQKKSPCAFPGWRINFSFWQELRWVTL